MVTCKECIYCRILATCWVCKKDRNGKIRSLKELEAEDVENCTHFTNDKLINILS
ncbi:MAG: hypothetical protein ACLFVX_09910 [Archaeoglobaceae archaeon]